MRLRVDQHHFDVAAAGGNRRRQVVEQAGAILGHDFDQRGRGARLVVKADGGGNPHLAARGLGLGTIAEQLAHVELAQNHALGRGAEPVHFRGVQFQRARGIGEYESVEHLAAAVGKGLRVEDVHAEAGQRAGHAREQAGTVAGNHRQLPGRFQAADIHRHAARLALHRERHVFGNFRFAVGAQIAHRQAFEQFRARSGGRFGNPLRRQFAGQFAVDRQVQPPQLGRTPWRHDVGIHRADVGISEDGEGFQTILGADDLRHIVDGFGIGQVARAHGQ